MIYFQIYFFLLIKKLLIFKHTSAAAASRLAKFRRNVKMSPKIAIILNVICRVRMIALN